MTPNFLSNPLYIVIVKIDYAAQWLYHVCVTCACVHIGWVNAKYECSPFSLNKYEQFEATACINNAFFEFLCKLDQLSTTAWNIWNITAVRNWSGTLIHRVFKITCCLECRILHVFFIVMFVCSTSYLRAPSEKMNCSPLYLHMLWKLDKTTRDFWRFLIVNSTVLQTYTLLYTSCSHYPRYNNIWI